MAALPLQATKNHAHVKNLLRNHLGTGRKPKGRGDAGISWGRSVAGLRGNGSLIFSRMFYSICQEEQSFSLGRNGARTGHPRLASICQRNQPKPLPSGPGSDVALADRLELVIAAYQQRESPPGIVEMYPDLQLGDVFAVLAFYPVNRTEVDEYLRQCDEQAQVVQRKIESFQRPGPTKEELLVRAQAKGFDL
jgi:hypothetical protein